MCQYVRVRIGLILFVYWFSYFLSLSSFELHDSFPYALPPYLLPVILHGSDPLPNLTRH